MRSRAVLQALSLEAAAVVKQAVVLAKRRDHAQVTPMHVATTMLAAGGGLLRAACLQSHSHPLQCKALELCFNVALNRLPAASPNPISGYYNSSHYPSISNALVAAFKRAQAHHRRGAPAADCDQHQNLKVKIELEHLIISILDDPSVSRVMREAGFSSPQVKNNIHVENKSISISSSQAAAAARESKENNVLILESSSPPVLKDENDDQDLNIIIQELVTRRQKSRSFVVVGESISKVEKTVRELMDSVERGGGALPEVLREVKFITIPPFHTFCNNGRELFEQKMGELRFLVKSHVGKGVVLYLGDMKWISEYSTTVEHMIMEVGRLVSEMEEITHGRFWVMGIGTFQTYMRCRNGYMNSLETIWRLHPLTIPANTLELSLVSQSGNEHADEAINERDDDQNGSSCQLQVNIFEAQKLSSLPPWLKDESRRLANNQQNCHDSMKENSTHRLLERRSLTLSSSTSPSSSTSNLHQSDTQKFKEFNAINLNTLCNALEEKVPRHKHIIPEIAGTILQCRSRMVRRKHLLQGNDMDLDILKEDTWLFFLGQDAKAKEEISRNLAKSVFGSYSNFVSIGMMSKGDDRVCSSYIYVESFAREVLANPHRVFLLEDFERLDCSSRMRVKRAIESGRLMSGENGEEFSLFDAIVVLSCERFSSSSRSGGGVCLDLNMSFGGDDHGVKKLHDDLGILEIVDRIVVFKIMDL